MSENGNGNGNHSSTNGDDPEAERMSNRDNRGRFTPGAGRWKKGESGNPGGRTSNAQILTNLAIDALKRTVAQHKAKLGPDRTMAEALVAGTIALALRGNSTALKELWERIDGKVPLPVVREDGPIEVIVNYDRKS